MSQLVLDLRPQPQRFEMGGAWFSTVDRKWYEGLQSIDLSWPWLTFL